MARMILYGLLLGSGLLAQNGRISTVAGGLPNEGPALKVSLRNPGNLALDEAGNLFVLHFGRITRLSPEGIVSIVAESQGIFCVGPSVPVAKASWLGIDWGGGIVANRDGEVMYAAVGCNVDGVWRVGKNGIVSRNYISTSPGHFSFDQEGSLILAERQLHRIRKFAVDGSSSVLAGSGQPGFAGDKGPADKAVVNFPIALVAAFDGSVFFADRGNFRIRRISRDGLIETVVGTGRVQFTADGSVGAETSIGVIEQLAIDPGGGLLFVDSTFRRVRRLRPDGIVETVAGNGEAGGKGDGGPALDASFTQPSGVAVDPKGNIFVSDYAEGIVRRVDAGSRLISTVAGLGRNTGEGQAALAARLGFPADIGVDKAGNVYFVDNRGSSTLRKLGVDGRLSTLIDPLPGSNRFAVDPDGTVYFGSSTSIRRMLVSGDIEVIAGGTIVGFEGDGGPASRALVNRVNDLKLDSSGNLYFYDAGNNRIRMIAADGTIRTVAGTGRTGFAGDGGPALMADFGASLQLAVDPSGVIFFSDRDNGRIRRIGLDGIITTIAGQPPQAPLIDGMEALNANTQGVFWLATDRQGGIFFSLQSRLWRISSKGRISLIAGTGQGIAGGDGGPSRLATLQPSGVSLTEQGDIYVSDDWNGRIRRIRPAGALITDPERFSMSQILSTSVRQTISISSNDDAPHGFSATVNVPWLKIEPNSGTIPARGAVTLSVETSAALAKGLSSTNINILDIVTGKSILVPVTVAVSGSAQQLRLSQAGLSFSALQNGPVPPAQEISILNVGTGAMTWTVAASTLAGGDWLFVTPPSGATPSPAAAPVVQVSVKTAGLAPGTYFGLVTVRSPQADNTPQSSVIVLNVLPAGTPPIAQVNPQGLIVTAPPDRAPNPPTVTISNISARTISYSSTLGFADRRSWFSLNPATGNIPPGESRSVQIVPLIGGIPVGQYRGQINFRITPDNVTRTVDLILVVHPLSASAPAKGAPLQAIGCVAEKISTLFRTPGPNFSTTAGWPTSVEVQAVNNCGEAITNGSVTVSFSTNDPVLPLQSLGNGRWSAAWTARTARASGVLLTARVENNAPRLTAQAQVTGGVGTNLDQPLIDREGVINWFTQNKETPIAVGTLVSVFGTRISTESTTAETSKPLPLQLGETRAFVSGQPLPLRETSPGRLDAFLPLGIAQNTRHQVIVQRGRSYSPPEELLITTSSPLVLTRENFGTILPLISKVVPDDNPVPVDASRPVKAGDFIHIFCSGLGPILGSLPPGEAATLGSRLAVAGIVKVEIEDLNATVSEAILAPGEVGVYRVTVQVPEGIADTVAARVIVSVNGVESNLVTIPVSSPVE